MGKRLQCALGAGLPVTTVLLLALSLAAPAAQGQGFLDRVIVISYVNVKPAQAGAWLVTFKKYFYPVLEEQREQGNLEGWHLFVPYVHHPGYTWTHALVLGMKDRAAQSVVEKKLRQALAGAPPAEAQAFYGAIDTAKHHDDEWIEIDLATVEVPAEKEEEKKKESTEGRQ